MAYGLFRWSGLGGKKKQGVSPAVWYGLVWFREFPVFSLLRDMVIIEYGEWRKIYGADGKSKRRVVW